MRRWSKLLSIIMVLTLAIASSPVNAKVQAAEGNPLTPAFAKTPGNANPLFSHKFGADPYAMVYDGRVYIYMTNDIFEYNANGTIKDNGYSRINKITVVSSDDMVNWTDHGEIPVAGQQGAAKWANNSWAPAAAHKTINGKEKFFLYFADSANGIGVLTADSPIGPFTDPIGKALISRSTPGVENVTWLFDPAVLMDDDGSGYIYFGGGIPAGKDEDPGTARVAKLGDDMISLDLAASGGKAKPINPPWLFEDSGINKYNGKYYYSYSTNFSGQHPPDIPTGTIAYMVSDHPLGPFTYVKTILPNPAVFFGVGGNNHHAMFEFNGQWYMTYHAQTVAKAMAESGLVPELGGQPHGYRNAHLNKVSFDTNGVIETITGDYAGIPQLKNLDPYKRVEAETIGWNGGISTEATTEPGGMVNSINLAVSSINNGDWTAVSQVDFGTEGAGTFTANVASDSSGGTIELRIDSADGPLIGVLPISNTGGQNAWKTKTASISGAAGVHDLYMVYKGAATGNLFKVDYWQFGKKNAVRDLVAINASVDKNKIDLVSGTNTAKMEVVAVYSDGTSEDVTAQANATPAQSGIVDIKNGVITGVGYGSTTVDISFGGKTDSISILVKDLNSELSVKQITVDNSSFALDSGQKANFKVTAEYVDGHTEDVTKKAVYDNPNPNIADVSNGTITAKASGTTQVVVSYRGELGEAATTQISITVDTPAVVAIEAEKAADNSEEAYVHGTIDGHTWSLVEGQSSKAMFFGPDTGFNMSGTDAATLATGSRLGYKINIPKAGAYQLWILAKSVDFNSDSLHVGVDQQYKFTSNGIEGISGGQFKWVNLSNGGSVVPGGAPLNLSAGEHELNFWGREDGLTMDRIYLTTSTSTTDPVWPSTEEPEPAEPAVALSATDSVKPGSSFTVRVNLNNLKESVYAQDIKLSYDADVFDYMSATSATYNVELITEDKDTLGEVRLISANIGGITGASTPVLDLTFKVKTGVQNTSGDIAVTRAELGTSEGAVIQAATDRKVISVGSIDAGVDKTALNAAITNAQNLYEAAVVGTLPGQYPQAAKDAFGIAINAAKAVKDNSSATQSQVDGAVTDLLRAIDTFKSAVIKEVSADLNKDGIINVGDLAIVAYHYGKDSTSPDWAKAKIADLNGDLKIDITDLAYVASKITD